MRGGVRQDPSAMQTLKLTDYEALRNETNFLAAVSPNVSSSGQLIAGNNNYPSSVSGVGTDYLEIRQLSVENGEMFTERHTDLRQGVCHRKDHPRQPFPRWRRPRRTYHTFQPNSFPRGGRTEI